MGIMGLASKKEMVAAIGTVSQKVETIGQRLSIITQDHATIMTLIRTLNDLTKEVDRLGISVSCINQATKRLEGQISLIGRVNE